MLSYILVPISLFTKEIFDFSVIYLRELPFYLFLFFIFISLLIGVKRDLLRNIFNYRVATCVIVIIIFQLFAMWLSFYEIGNNPINRDPIYEFTRLIIFIFSIYLHYISISLIINNNKINILRFIKGNGVALAILLGIVYIQMLYLVFPNIFNGVVSFIGKFEKNFNRGWYDEGSYVQTVERINGLNPEASYLAVQLLVIFTPFILASMKNKVNIFSIKRQYNPIFFTLLLFSVIIALFFSKSSTGLLAILLIFIIYWLRLPLKRKIITGVFLLILILITYIITNNNPIVSSIIEDYFFSKGGSDSTLNRQGGTIALIITWLTNFVTGVGWNFHDYYLFLNVPDWATNNYEFQNIYYPMGFFPILSVFFGWLAEFGTISMLFVIVFIYKLLRDFRSFSVESKIRKMEPTDIKLINVLNDAAHYFVLFYFVCSLLVFDWSESIYLIMFFFFVTARTVIKENITKASINTKRI